MTASCASVAPPHCSAPTATATTAGRPARRPARRRRARDPAGRALSLVVVKAPEHGTLAGLRYTPARRLHRARTRRPTASATASRESEPSGSRSSSSRGPAPAPRPVATRRRRSARAPFLSARATPRLDRRRRALVRLSCDQACSLDGAPDRRGCGSKRTLHGHAGQALARGRAGAVRCGCGCRRKPRGHAARRSGSPARVRNAAGDVRTVKLPVRLPR